MRHRQVADLPGLKACVELELLFPSDNCYASRIGALLDPDTDDLRIAKTEVVLVGSKDLFDIHMLESLVAQVRLRLFGIVESASVTSQNKRGHQSASTLLRLVNNNDS